MKKATTPQTFAHKINEYVMYRQNGICRITDIRTEEFSSMGPKTYYVLTSVYDERLTVFVPVDSPLAEELRHVLSADEINEIIRETERNQTEWQDDSKARALSFDTIFKEGDRAQVLWVVKILSQRKLELEAQKKKLYASDERVLAAAQKLITEEFAFVLGLNPDEVMPFIIEKIHHDASA